MPTDPRLASLLPGAQQTFDSHIYCDACEDVRPLVRAYMPADGIINTHAATDLLCADCRLIIATIHHLQAPPVALND